MACTGLDGTVVSVVIPLNDILHSEAHFPDAVIGFVVVVVIVVLVVVVVVIVVFVVVLVFVVVVLVVFVVVRIVFVVVLVVFVVALVVFVVVLVVFVVVIVVFVVVILRPPILLRANLRVRKPGVRARLALGSCVRVKPRETEDKR